MLSHIEPYLLMPSALTPTALLERADQIAAAVTINTLTGPVRVRHTPLYDAWLLPWEQDAVTSLHAHDGSYGAYVALSGTFRETIASESGIVERVVLAGEKVAFRPGYTHSLTTSAPAVSLHLFSPPRPSGPCAVTPAATPVLASL
jgi:Cysteine dioxygenase type I